MTQQDNGFDKIATISKIQEVTERISMRNASQRSNEEIKLLIHESGENARKWMLNRVNEANLPDIYRAATFETNEKGVAFDKTGESAGAWDRMHDIAYKFSPGMRGCILFGIAGAGKTVMAVVTAKRLIKNIADARTKWDVLRLKNDEMKRRGKTGIEVPERPLLPTIGMIIWSDWANKMAEAMSQRKYSSEPATSRDALMAQITGPTLLIVDDIGKNEGLKEDQARAYMYMLVNERYINRRARGYVTIYTTNLSAETIAERYNDPGDKAIDEGPDAYGVNGTRINGATTSRLLHDCDYYSVGTFDRRLAGRDD